MAIVGVGAVQPVVAGNLDEAASLGAKAGFGFFNQHPAATFPVRCLGDDEDRDSSNRGSAVDDDHAVHCA
ncbi:MAG: hypothetical protein NVS3B5_23750 [Sphingomicrobium sp.]